MIKAYNTLKNSFKMPEHSVSVEPLSQCPECKYTFEGLPANGSCPECGLEYDEYCRAYYVDNQKHAPQRLIIIGLVLLLILVVVSTAVWFTTDDFPILILLPFIIPILIFSGMYFFIKSKYYRKIIKRKPYLTVSGKGIRNIMLKGMQDTLTWDNINYVGLSNVTKNKIKLSLLVIGRVKQKDTAQVMLQYFSPEQAEYFLDDALARVPEENRFPGKEEIELCVKCHIPLDGMPMQRSCTKCHLTFDQDNSKYTFYNRSQQHYGTIVLSGIGPLFINLVIQFVNEPIFEPTTDVLTYIFIVLAILSILFYLSYRRAKKKRELAGFTLATSLEGVAYWGNFGRSRFLPWNKIGEIYLDESEGFIKTTKTNGKARKTKLNTLPLSKYEVEEFLEEANRRIEASK